MYYMITKYNTHIIPTQVIKQYNKKNMCKNSLYFKYTYFILITTVLTAAASNHYFLEPVLT